MTAKVTQLRLGPRKCASGRALAANRIRRARIELGLTQEQAALQCGVSSRSWGAWERGDVSMPALEALCALEAMAERKAA
jgi:transcriptional regulator with XRE-family HTH domain